MDSKEINDFRLSYENRQKLGTILLINAPKEMQFGIDLSQWVVGNKFMGIKLIPLGIHFISFSLSSENHSFKQGFFIDTRKRRNNIRKWSEKLETFTLIGEEMTKNYEIGLDNLEFDQRLGDYPIQQKSNWSDLISFLTIEKIIDLQKNLNSIIWNEAEELNEDNEENPNIISTQGINFTDIPINQPNKLNELDKSHLLEKILSNYKNFNNLLGEFQYSFILFLIGESYDALKQWKDIFILITSSEKIITTRETLFCNFTEVIYNQLRLFPDDLFSDVILNNIFIKRYLSNFLLYEINSNKFSARQKLLKKFVEEKFGYKIQTEEERIINNYLLGIKSYDNNDEINDDLPVVVDESELNKKI